MKKHSHLKCITYNMRDIKGINSVLYYWMTRGKNPEICRCLISIAHSA